MGKILHFKAICNHEVAMIQENSDYIVRDYSLVKSEAKTEKFSTFGAALQDGMKFVRKFSRRRDNGKMVCFNAMWYSV